MFLLSTVSKGPARIHFVIAAHFRKSAFGGNSAALKYQCILVGEVWGSHTRPLSGAGWSVGSDAEWLIAFGVRGGIWMAQIYSYCL